MRSFIFFVMLALPGLAHASDQCAPHETFAQVAAQKGNSTSGPFSVDAIEKEHMFTRRDTGETLPFGYSNKEWLGLKAAMRPGDEIYYLSHRDGRFFVEYHVLVRDGCIVRLMQGRIS